MPRSNNISPPREGSFPPFEGFRRSRDLTIPADIMAYLLSHAHGSVLSVVLYVALRTIGYGKLWDVVSQSQFLRGVQRRNPDGSITQLDEGCGIRSAVTLGDALNKAVDQGFLVRVRQCARCKRPITDDQMEQVVGRANWRNTETQLERPPEICPHCDQRLIGQLEIRYTLRWARGEEPDLPPVPGQEPEQEGSEQPSLFDLDGIQSGQAEQLPSTNTIDLPTSTKSVAGTTIETVVGTSTNYVVAPIETVEAPCTESVDTWFTTTTTTKNMESLPVQASVQTVVMPAATILHPLVAQRWQDANGQLPTATEWEGLAILADRFEQPAQTGETAMAGWDWIAAAVQDAHFAGQRPIAVNLIRRICERWAREGFATRRDTGDGPDMRAISGKLKALHIQPSDTLVQVIRLYSREGGSLTASALERLAELAGRFTDLSWWESAFKQTALERTRRMERVVALLEQWQLHGYMQEAHIERRAPATINSRKQTKYLPNLASATNQEIPAASEKQDAMSLDSNHSQPENLRADTTLMDRLPGSSMHAEQVWKMCLHETRQSASPGRAWLSSIHVCGWRIQEGGRHCLVVEAPTPSAAGWVERESGILLPVLRNLVADPALQLDVRIVSGV